MNARSSLRKTARSLVSSSGASASSSRSGSRSLHQTALLSQQAEASTSTTGSTSSASDASSATTLVSSLILSRPPSILRKPSKFEAAYFQYNRQLSEALQQPFPKDFYFKKGSAAEKRFEEDQVSTTHGFVDPKKATGKKGATAGKGSESSNSSQATTVAEGDAESQPLPRETEADMKNDLQSLQRKLDRTLYLVVKGSKPGWSFPKRTLDRQAKENLHVAAPLSVTGPLGKNIDIWLVSNAPVGLYQSGAAEKTYFMRGHIVAGHPQLAEDKDGEVKEYRWLTREEVQELLQSEAEDAKYWKTIDDLLDP